MKNILTIILAVSLSIAARGQQAVNVQKTSGTNTITGNIVVGDGRSITATGTGTIVATNTGAPSLTATYVGYGSAGGLLTGTSGFTFNAGTGAVTATNFVGTFAGNTFTTGTGTLTLAASKTLTANDNITLTSDGTGTRTLNIAAGGTLGSNAFTSTGYLPLTGGTLTGNLLFTDNTYDIGASGATRPRSIYVGTSFIVPGGGTITGAAGAVTVTPTGNPVIIGGGAFAAPVAGTGIIYADSINGLLIGGRGSVYDFQLLNRAGGSVLLVPTNTTGATFGSNVTVPTLLTLSSTSGTSAGGIALNTGVNVFANNGTSLTVFSGINCVSIDNATGLKVAGGQFFGFTSSTDSTAAIDTKIDRVAAGSWGVNRGLTTTGATDLLINPTTKASGNLWDAQVNGVSKGSLTSAGALTLTAGLTATTGTFSDTISTSTAGKTLSIKSGTNAAAGTVTLVAGNATITSTAIDVNTVIIFSEKTSGGTPSLYQPLATVSAGSAAVTGAVTDTSTYNWVALKVN